MGEKSEHTQGPWNWHTNIGLNATKPESIHGPKGEIVLSWFREYGSPCDSGNTVTSVSDANARLIIAAPETAAERDRLKEENAEMLEALEHLLIDAIILSDDYLSTFSRKQDHETVQGWDIGRWRELAQQRKKPAPQSPRRKEGDMGENEIEPTSTEKGWLSMMRYNRLCPRKEILWKRSFGRIKVQFNWRSKKNLLGRFGGGWNWELGFQAGGRTVIFSLLICMVRISLKKKKAKGE